MNAQALLVDRRPIRLARQIGKGGEGEVYVIDGDADHAVKLYTVPDVTDRELKVEAMIRAGLAKQAPQVAFPVAVARHPNGGFAGFVMKLVANHKALHELYPPGSRKRHFPKADYRFLVRAALNISKAIASVHRLGCVIGDINHSSILVSQDATVALIDSDSFQITDNNQLLCCRVGVPEYTPPELQGVRLDSVSRTPNHDAFGLAIVIFQLLFMGRHPFIGTLKRGDLPLLHDAIKDYRFVYTDTRDVGMTPPPGTPTLRQFPTSVASSFESAFGAKASGARPSAASWVMALTELEQRLVQCADETLHWYPACASNCPWCAMEKTVGATLFVPYVPPAQLNVHPFDPGAGGFRLEEIWHQIESFPPIDRLQLIPTVAASDIQTSGRVQAAVRNRKISLAMRAVAACSATGILFFSSASWFLWLPLYLLAVFWKSESLSFDTTSLNARYIEIDRRLETALLAWFKKLGVDDLEKLRSSLRQAKDAYEALPSEERAQRDAHNRDRRARQLAAFLDGFEIRRAKIKGIGPAKQAALYSYGIETAADVEQVKVLTVPGFGKANSTNLLQWRRQLESRFSYSEQPNEVDRQALVRIVSGIQGKASALRRALLAGHANLETLSRRVKTMAAVKDNELQQLLVLREQIRAEIEEIGGTAPATPALNSASLSPPVSTRSAQARSVASAPSQFPAQKSCPRCRSPMVLRQARRGNHAGSQFWDCSKYPICKATVNT